MKGATIHWVDAATAVEAECRLYDNLFSDCCSRCCRQEFPGLPEPRFPGGGHRLQGGGGLKDAVAPASFQFMRVGYFCLDNKDSRPGHLVFNRSVSLKDSFKK